MRQIVLDTETTGLETTLDHRIIEIGCLELENRRPTGRTFHRFLNPERDVDEGAFHVHGISREALADQPRFAEVVDEFLCFIQGAELIIHNADFDVGFLNYELGRLADGRGCIEDYAQVTDTLAMARRKHPGQRNSLDALCKRYDIDNSHRELHGALLDARILAGVYLAMTGGQTDLYLGADEVAEEEREVHTHRMERGALMLHIIRASEEEYAAHEAMLQAIDKQSGKRCVWLQKKTPHTATPLLASVD
jgi:DNA polymerase III subunit epsilon